MFHPNCKLPAAFTNLNIKLYVDIVNGYDYREMAMFHIKVKIELPVQNNYLRNT